MASTTSCDGGPNRSSTFWPGGGAKVTSSRSVAATSVTGRCVVWLKPSVRDAWPSGTRVSRWAALSTTTSSAPSTYAADGSASPLASVSTSRVAGS